MTWSWLALPALALVAAAIFVAVRAFAARSRALPNGSANVIAAAAAGVLGALEVALAPHVARGALAGAAAVLALAELARPRSESRWPAAIAAAVAAVLDPGFVPLAALVGARLPRRAIALTIAAPCVGLAVASALATDGALAALFDAWTGSAARPIPLPELARHAGDALGPIATTCALAGLVACARGGRAGAAVLATALGTALVAWRTGSVSPAAMTCAAMWAGVAIARLAALVRLPSGQIFVGAMAAWLVVVGPVAAAL